MVMYIILKYLFLTTTYVWQCSCSHLNLLLLQILWYRYAQNLKVLLTQLTVVVVWLLVFVADHTTRETKRL